MNLFSDLDPPPNRIERLLAQQHSPTSVAAAEAIQPTAGTLRQAVLDAIRASAGGLSDEEGIAFTGMSASSYRPRRVELIEAGLVRDSGRTRLTTSGRKAVVWEAAR